MGCPRPGIIADHELIMLVVNGDTHDTNDFLQVQENNADAILCGLRVLWLCTSYATYLWDDMKWLVSCLPGDILVGTGSCDVHH
jgi:hypothetical protein